MKKTIAAMLQVQIDGFKHHNKKHTTTNAPKSQHQNAMTWDRNMGTEVVGNMLAEQLCYL